MASKLPLVLDAVALIVQQIQSTDIVAAAALGTGTANSDSFLRGDGVWSAPLYAPGSDYYYNGGI